MRVIWTALLLSTVMYLVVLLMLGRRTGSFEEHLRDPIVIVLYFAALVDFAIGNVVPSFTRTAPARVRMIISLAIFESCAIFGLIAAFLKFDYRLYIAPWAIAIIGFLRMFPSGESALAERSPFR